MTIAHDQASEVAAGTGTLSWTHTPVGTPRGVFVAIAQNVGQTDEVTGVTYGGTAMTRLGTVADTGGEPGRVYLYFLGASIPTEAQTVQVSVNGTGSTKWASAATVTAAGDTQVAGDGAKTTSVNEANPSLTVSTIAGASYGAGVLFSGINAPANIAAGSGFTKRHDHDFGNQTAAFETSTSEQASGDHVIAWTTASDDVAFVAAAIEEIDLSQDVTPGLISSTASTFSPTITPGAVSVSPALINAAAAVFAPTISQAGPQSASPGLIEQIAAAIAPTITPGNVNVAPPLIGVAASVFAPELAQAGGGGGGGFGAGFFIPRKRRRR